MRVTVIYDSVYGNTEQVARAIGAALSGEVKVLRAGEANPAGIKGLDLLIIGSPTQGGRPLPAVRDFIDRIPASDLKGVKVAAFDTRVPAKWVAIFRFAAGRIAASLKNKGANLIAPPEGFFVTGTKGPMKEGELERTAEWARLLTGSK